MDVAACARRSRTPPTFPRGVLAEDGEEEIGLLELCERADRRSSFAIFAFSVDR